MAGVYPPSDDPMLTPHGVTLAASSLAAGLRLPPSGELEDEEEGDDEESEAMSLEDLEAFLNTEMTECDSVQMTLSEQRKLATDYYHGELYGDEEDGRSKVVTREVQDTVNAIMPNLMRIFFGPEHVAEFSPRGPEDVGLAEQMTDYVDYVFKVDNPGFMVLYTAFQDALIRATGPVKWWWEKSTEVTEDEFSGLSEEAVMQLAADTAADGGEIFPMPGPDGLYSALVRRKRTSGQIRVQAIPPEEFLISAKARDIDSARVVAHRRLVSVSELVSMGYDEEEIEEYANISAIEPFYSEARKRMPVHTPWDSSTTDEAGREVLYTEAYAKVDFDGDGIAELRKICAVGENYHILHHEPANERPFADFCPQPEAHTVFGTSIAELVMDIQRIKSSVFRRILDSLAQSIHPRTAIVEGQANLDDVMNTAMGAPIRMRAPGMVQPFVVPFVGPQALPVVDYFDQVKQDRTGISKAAAGLDADALQSTTKAAVAATVSAANSRIEMIARIFAETGMKRIMQGVAKLAARHQDKARIVRLRNQWVQVSPADWNTSFDVQVNVAVGAGTVEEKVMALERIAQRQEAILQQYGPQNPLVTVAQYRNTLAKIIEFAGFRDPGQFFSPVPHDYQPPPPQPPQDPQAQATTLLAQVQAEQIRADIAMKREELALKHQEMLLRDDRERDKNEAEILLKVREMELKYQASVDTAQITAAINRERAQQPMGGNELG